MDEERRLLKQEIVQADRGPFIGWWEALLHHSPNALRRVHELLNVAELGTLISERMRHLIWTAVDSVVTHLFPRGIGVHAEVAMKHGATVRQVIEALEIAATVSSRSFQFGLPLILEALAERSEKPQLALTAAEQDRKSRISKRIGYWEGWMDAALATAPDYLEMLLGLGYPTVADPEGLDAKSRALIFFACSACPAIVDRDATLLHARRAIDSGATKDELIQVLQLANCIGVHPLSTGITAIDEFLSKTQPAAAS
jgi:alkylhydroperoxidase/carboxymuconolactone decarboxylase family protein YurZ